jgi:hypothetical protein
VRSRRPLRPKSGDLRQLAWRAWFATAMAAVVAAAPMLGTLHRAFVRHAVCEHGDLIELPDEQQAQRGSSQFEAGGRATRIGQASGTSVHQHDHCLVSALGRSAAGAPAHGTIFQRLTAQKSRIGPSEGVSRCALSILSLAPKTSPPIA